MFDFSVINSYRQRKCPVSPNSTCSYTMRLQALLLLDFCYQEETPSHASIFLLKVAISSHNQLTSVEINNGGQVPSSKEPAVMGDEKRESLNVRFKTDANITSPNANWLKECNADRRTQQGSNAVKRLKG